MSSVGAANTRTLPGAEDGVPSAVDTRSAAEGPRSQGHGQGSQNGASGSGAAAERGDSRDERASEVPAEIVSDVGVQEGVRSSESAAEDVVQNPGLAQIAVRLTDGSFLRCSTCSVQLGL